MWRRLGAGGRGRVGRDGSKKTRKEVTALVQTGDEPRQEYTVTVPGRGDGSTDQTGGKDWREAVRVRRDVGPIP